MALSIEEWITKSVLKGEGRRICFIIITAFLNHHYNHQQIIIQTIIAFKL